jgi:hypothetical protein
MKVFTTILKIVAALAAIAGVIYVVATYGDEIVAWCKKMLSKFSSCKCCTCGEDCECDCDGDCQCGEGCKCAEETAVVEEVAAEEAPVEEPAEVESEVAIEEGDVVADENDFEG